MKFLLSKCRSILGKVLGIPELLSSVYRSDFPDGRLVGKPVQLGRFSIIDYGGGVEFGKNVKVGYGVYIISTSTIRGSKQEAIIRKPIIIGDNAEIGAHATILPGVIIGTNATIGAGAVVTQDIPENSVAVGVPARVVKRKI